MATKAKSKRTGRTYTRSGGRTQTPPAVAERSREIQRERHASATKASVSDAPVATPVPPPRVEEEEQTVPPEQRKFKIVRSAPETIPQTMMGRAIRPFAKPGQAGSFAPFAVAQARRGR